MTTLREAATQALEALVRASSYYDTYAEIAALEAALAEPGQEPVAWASKRTLARIKDFDSTIYANGGFDDAVPLYTAPPASVSEAPQRKPLTEEAIETAHIEIWRTLPSDFDHTSAGWIEMGIRYAERAHGIE